MGYGEHSIDAGYLYSGRKYRIFLLIKLGQTAEFIFRGFLGNQKERAHVV